MQGEHECKTGIMFQSLNTTFLLITGWLLSIIVLFLFFKIKFKRLRHIATDKGNEDIYQLKNQQKKIEIEKKKLEEKNRKIWQMGEAALKEKHKIDEQVIQLQVEKETFAIEKKRYEEKIKKLWATSTSIHKERSRSDELLLNILPFETATELKATGKVIARKYDLVTVMFTDFKNFTKLSEQMSAEELVQEINYCYSEFDRIISNHNIEKIKTIGDSYMCAGGIPVENETHALDMVKTALEIQQFIKHHSLEKKQTKNEYFEIRIGIHTGPVIAGVVGIKKFAYDIWGDTVNTASRMETSGEAGKVNISGVTYELIKNQFNCTYRGKIEAKNKGEVDMYFVESIL